MTHPAASYHPSILRRTLTPLIALAVLPLAACGGQSSTLPPSPGASGAVTLSYLAHDPEVYADATLTTVGTVARAAHSRPPLFVLDGGHGARIVLEPSSRAAGELGRRVRVSGLFTVSFELGYEILVSRIVPAGSL